ncbi:MAG: sulfite exporter TauE/SafE family protein [Planctomycetota bacterium]
MADPIVTLVIGLVAGVVGGLVGIGGSIVMLPALALIVGYEGPDQQRHHVFTGAAMVVNVVVAAAATWRHQRARAIRGDVVLRVLPGMTGGIIAGVLLADLVDGQWLRRMLGLVILVYGVRELFRKPDPELVGPPPPVRIGGAVVALSIATGVIAGLLGIGGGIVLVPALIVLARLDAKASVATTAAAMIISSLFGSALKLWRVEAMPGFSAGEALELAWPMAIGALVGAPLGAGLTHRLPSRQLRLAMAIVLAVAGGRLVL